MTTFGGGYFAENDVFSLSSGCAGPETGGACYPGAYVFRVPNNTGYGVDVQFSPDGSTLASAPVNPGPGGNCPLDTFQVGSWAPKASTEVITTQEGCSPQVGFAPDSQALAVGDYQLQILNNDSQLSLQSTLAYDLGQVAIAYSPDGSFVVSGGVYGTAEVWNAATGAIQSILQGIAANSATLSIAVSPEPVAPYGYLIAVASYVDNASGYEQLTLYSSATGAEVSSAQVDPGVVSVAFLSANSILVTGNYANANLWIYSTPSLTLTKTISNSCESSEDGSIAASAAFTDGKSAAVACGGSYASIVSLTSGDTVKVLDTSYSNASFLSIAVSPDSTEVAIGVPNSVEIYNASTGDLKRTITLPANSQIGVPTIAYSRDGATIADGGGQGSTLFFLDAANGKILQRWTQQTSAAPPNIGLLSIVALAYSADNQFVYYGRGDGTTVMLTNPISAPPLALLQSVNGGTVTGGQTLTGTVLLNPAVPEGESVVINLKTNNTAVATVPASVTVPAGAESATFPITTTTVTAKTRVTVTASEGKDIQTANVTVKP